MLKVACVPLCMCVSVRDVVPVLVRVWCSVTLCVCVV